MTKDQKALLKSIDASLDTSSLYRHIFRLFERWLDEHAYENIDDYAKNLKKAVESAGIEDLEIVGMVGHPFRITMRRKGITVHMMIKASPKTYDIVWSFDEPEDGKGKG